MLLSVVRGTIIGDLGATISVVRGTSPPRRTALAKKEEDWELAILSLQGISVLTAQVIVTELRLARYEQAQEGTVPEEMEMEPLSLPGWAAPTLAGTLPPP